MVTPIDAQTSRCRHIAIQDQPPDLVSQMSHLVSSHFHHRSLGIKLSVNQRDIRILFCTSGRADMWQKLGISSSSE
uniref:Uncharacterized protein n=1 Tax=Angiostrongylus cantonensis TaxID=6313 RepID=A0A0K0CVP8_ANGCA